MLFMTQHFQHSPVRSRARGISLIELLVGIVIGLLTVVVAMGGLLVSRTVTGTVSDTSQMQQQAANAFRIIGQQMRQAGSLKLNLAAQKPEGSVIDMADKVAFETKVGDFDPANTIRGKASPASNEYAVTVVFRNYVEPVYTAASDTSLFRNCLGRTTSDSLVQSAFVLYVNPNDASQRELRCDGAAPGGTADPQPIAQNVANFQVRYVLQEDAAPFGNPQIRYVDADGVGANWAKVTAVEVCLVLYGDESIDMPSGTSYVDCDNSTSVNMTALAAPRKNRNHLVFRNAYQLRSQGLVKAS
jgi:type IV pilus assembly protein PilW